MAPPFDFPTPSSSRPTGVVARVSTCPAHFRLLSRAGDLVNVPGRPEEAILEICGELGASRWCGHCVRACAVAGIGGTSHCTANAHHERKGRQYRKPLHGSLPHKSAR
jgi:hypothetical protein